MVNDSPNLLSPNDLTQLRAAMASGREISLTRTLDGFFYDRIHQDSNTCLGMCHAGASGAAAGLCIQQPIFQDSRGDGGIHMSVTWYCTRQRAGPLIKECRALRPPLGPSGTRQDAADKRQLRRNGHSAVSRSQVDRLELRLALFGYEGSHYTLTYDFDHLPKDYDGVRRYFRAFLARAKRWRHGDPFDWIVCIEGRHGDHRYHIHLILRDSQFSPAEVRYLWRGGEVDDEPVLRKEGGCRRLAEYFNKERPDGFKIPLGKHPWSCNLPLSRSLEPREEWEDESGVIDIPDDVLWARRGQVTNDFGAYYYASYILPRKPRREKPLPDAEDLLF